jgi:hypothetical protein
MNWALFDSPHDPGSDWPDIGSRPASRARGFAPTSHRDGHMTRAIRDLFDSCNMAMVFDELHFRTHSQTDMGYDPYLCDDRYRYAPKSVHSGDVFRVAVCRASRDAFYAKVADLLIGGVS